MGSEPSVSPMACSKRGPRFQEDKLIDWKLRLPVIQNKETMEEPSKKWTTVRQHAAINPTKIWESMKNYSYLIFLAAFFFCQSF